MMDMGYNEGQVVTGPCCSSTSWIKLLDFWRVQLETEVFRLGEKRCLMFRKLKKKERILVNCCLSIPNNLICVL